MAVTDLPETAAWSHHQARTGFEVVHFTAEPDGFVAHGSTAAVEDGHTWVVTYAISVGQDWRTRHATVSRRTVAGRSRTVLETDGAGNWLVDGAPAEHLRGCLDVDLESSVLTNAFPVQRLALTDGQSAEAPAAYVQAMQVAVTRLDQQYTRVVDNEYDYAAPGFDFRCRLKYDPSGLVLDYPGIAARSA